MDDGEDYSGVVNLSSDSTSALNSTILNYYKKFGRKRDLEQFFSLSTAQSEIRDPTSSFWRRMKSQSDSDSGGKLSESPTEICRISIKCSVPDTLPSGFQDEEPRTRSDSESPPIITEDVAADTSRHTEDESVKSDDNQSQKSADATLDTSMNKPFSPTSSITSRRKLEWDSLADVGYANETGRKASASNLSTLERLALKQQYSNNDTMDPIGPPTSHSTPQDEDDNKVKGKKAVKTTKIYRRDFESFEVNMPHSSEMNSSQAINVNLTKHITFNVDKGGGVHVENVQEDVAAKPDKISVAAEVPAQVTDKEIQTTLTKSQHRSSCLLELPKNEQLHGHSVPVLINLNSLRNRNRKKKLRLVKKKLRTKRKVKVKKEYLPVQEKSGEQVSEAESFEYMPGHIYNQNHMKVGQLRSSNAAGNKSSLESSGVLTTDSSKGSKLSFTRDLEKSINLLKEALHKRYDDSNLKQKLIKEIVQRLLKTNYRGDESATDFLSGISFNSRRIGLGESNHTTTSTSDINTTGDKTKVSRPKKSILRVDKFNPQTIASTSQSAPNLPSVLASEKPITSNLKKRNVSSTTESDVSSKEKNSSDTAFAKTSSEELYQKYIDALRREEAYKRHLRDKEVFLKQKLVSSDGALKIPTHVDVKSQNRLKALMKDLTRNNYDDGSGDASKLECGSNSNISFEKNGNTRKQRSHSVFTLSSGTSEAHKRNADLRQSEHDNFPKSGNHYCCCPYHSRNNKIGFTDSSVQVNLNRCGDEQKQKHTSRNIAHVVPDDKTGDVQYLCLCNTKAVSATDKCLCLNNRGIQSQKVPLSNIDSSSLTNTDGKLPFPSTSKYTLNNIYHDMERASKSSQTNLPLLLRQKKCDKSLSSSSSKNFDPRKTENNHEKVLICEATRCIQTGISINPKISDPSLSDMKIVSDHDCMELIDEKYREVSKSTIQTANQRNISQMRLDTEFSDDGSAASERCNDDDERNKNVMKVKDNGRCFGKGIQANYDNLRRKGDITKGEAIQDNFTIPIQGTNMTLMVSLGTNRDKSHLETLPNQQITRVVATDAVDAIDQGTSLMEECSKGIQSQNTNIFSEIGRPTRELPQEIDLTRNNVNEPCMVNTIFTREGFFQSIYPDERQVTEMAEQDPYLRLNTNRRDLEKSCCIQIASDNNIFAKASKETITRKHLFEPDIEMTVEQKSIYPEISKYGDVCREDAECLRQRPFIRSNTDTEVLAKHVTTSPRTENLATNRSLQNKKFRSINTDTYDLDEVILDKESPILIDKASTKKQLMSPIVNDDAKPKPKPFIGSNIDTCNVSKSISPKTVFASKDDNATACVKPKPFVRSNTDTGNLGKNISPKNIYQSLHNRPKCKCPESSKCAGKCGENAECIKQKPRLESTDTDLDNLAETSKQSKNLTPRSTDTAQVSKPKVFTGSTCDDFVEQKSSYKDSPRDTYQVETLKKSTCNCPVPSKCGGMCRDNAPCLKQLDTVTHKVVSQDLNFNTLPKIDKSGDLKTLLRSNTDTSNMNQDCIQADYESKKNAKSQSSKHADENQSLKSVNKTSEKSISDSQTTDSAETGTSKDLVLEMIQDITKRYSKKDIPKSQRKKCFKEIMSILNYLLDTEESPDPDHVKSFISTHGNDAECSTVKSKEMENICVSCRKNRDKVKITESSSQCTECGNDSKKLPPNQVKRSTKNETDPVLCSANCMCGKGSECVCRKKKYMDKGVQLSTHKSKTAKDCRTESSDNPVTSDMPFTSSDSATCKVLNKIKKECEKFHQKRCLSHGVKRCECSSSTSVNCDNCKRVHHCPCRGHKCRGHRSKTTVEKVKKKCVAYNLIIQTSESMISEENPGEKICRPLQNIVVKVPPKRHCINVPFKELSTKIEERQGGISRKAKCQRSRSLPNESGLSSADENVKRTEMYTVREYLERNRPEFVEQCSKRQNCLKFVNETRTRDPCGPPALKMIVVHTPNCNGCVDPYAMYYDPSAVRMNCSQCNILVDPYMHVHENEVTRLANERAAKRKLLSLQVRTENLATLNSLSESDLRHLARELGAGLKRKTDAPKFISERNMKKHSEKIYKGLPEVTQKKEAAKKEGIKKTNLLMANIFKRNLQKKTLSGAVNLSNYSTVVKI